MKQGFVRVAGEVERMPYRSKAGFNTLGSRYPHEQIYGNRCRLCEVDRRSRG